MGAGISKLTLLFLIIATLSSGCTTVVMHRPDNPEIIIIPTSPAPGFIYMSDSWVWNKRTRAYQISRGHWVQPKRSLIWVDGHWKQTHGGWKYAKGHWQ